VFNNGKDNDYVIADINFEKVIPDYIFSKESLKTHKK